MGTERRAYLECRAESADGKRITGHAIVFNSLSVDIGGFREIIAPEAVDRAITEGADVRALVDHDSGKVIGRTRAGTLDLRKDSRGLRITIEPDLEISYARDIMRAVARGDVSGMSFGFRAISDEWDYDGTMPIRTVRDMAISEISVVAFPAYSETDVQARSVFFNTGEALRSLQAFKQANPMRTARWCDTKLRLAI